MKTRNGVRPVSRAPTLSARRVEAVYEGVAMGVRGRFIPCQAGHCRAFSGPHASSLRWLAGFSALMLAMHGTFPMLAATAVLLGEYTSELSGVGAQPQKSAVAFRAEMDEKVLHISYEQTPPRVPRGYGIYSGPSLIDHWISPSNWVMVYQPERLPGAGTSVVINRPEYPELLGNCGDAVASAVLLTLRGLSFFGPMTNSRAVAPPWRHFDEPLSLVTLAEYASGQDGSITGRIVVARDLLARWQDSPLLSVAYPDRDATRRALAKMSALRPGLVCGAFRLQNVTNFAGQSFPTFGEFLQLPPPMPNTGATNARAGRQDARRDTVVITQMERSAAPVPEFPVIDGQLQVVDRRLSDRRVHVVQGIFTTNRLDSLEIAAQAKVDFERRREKELALLRTKARARFFRGLLVACVVLIPGAIAAISWLASHRSKRQATPC